MGGHSDAGRVRAILGDFDAFLAEVVDGLHAKGFDLEGREIDHACFRVETAARYEGKKGELATIGRLLHEAIIGGRLIATYELTRPLAWRGFKIPLVELPAPKGGRPYPEGLEHIEVVIDEPFASFMARHPHVEFDTSAMGKAVNAELRVPVGRYSAKFHHQSLKDVIAADMGAKPVQTPAQKPVR